jgi:hypothetical protein
MSPDPHIGNPVVDYLLKEISFSTCDNKFFGELEGEMLIPNNLNIYGRLKGATSLKGYSLRVEFPEETTIAYLRRPVSIVREDGKKVLTYNLEDLVNYDDYWWLPLQDETEFSLALNLLPPFQKLNPIDLHISCLPDIVVGVDAEVNTNVRIEAREHIDNLFLTMSTASFAAPGVSVTITEYSDDHLTEPKQTVTTPRKQFPFPKLSLKPSESREYRVKTRIKADLTSLTSLKCQQDLVRAKLVILSDSSPTEPPCNIAVLDDQENKVMVRTTMKSTILQAQAQIMYSPFSIRSEEKSKQQVPVIASTVS